MTGDEVSLRELTPCNEGKPRVMKMGKRNIKAQVGYLAISQSIIYFFFFFFNIISFLDIQYCCYSKSTCHQKKKAQYKNDISNKNSYVN